MISEEVFSWMDDAEVLAFLPMTLACLAWSVELICSLEIHVSDWSRNVNFKSGLCAVKYKSIPAKY